MMGPTLNFLDDIRCYFSRYRPNADSVKQLNSMMYSEDMIFDLTDIEMHNKIIKEKTDANSPLELFLLGLFAECFIDRRTNPAVLETFMEIMNPTIAIKVSYNKYLDSQNEMLNNINKVQDYLLDSLVFKKDLAIEGSAGSGKTFVAMKKAIRLLEMRKKTLILCYNRKLKQFIIDQTKQMEKDQEILDEGENIEDFIICKNIFEFAGWFAGDLPDGQEKTDLLNGIRKYNRENVLKYMKQILGIKGFPKEKML